MIGKTRRLFSLFVPCPNIQTRARGFAAAGKKANVMIGHQQHLDKRPGRAGAMRCAKSRTVGRFKVPMQFFPTNIFLLLSLAVETFPCAGQLQWH